MRCGLDCLQFLGDYLDRDVFLGMNYLEDHLSEKGVSIFHLCEAITLCDLKYRAFSSFLIPKQFSILLLKGRKSDHYVVLLEKKIWSVCIYDGTYGIRKINKIMMYFLWKHIAISIER